MGRRTILSLAAFLSLAQESDYRIAPKLRVPPEIQLLLARVDAANDEWTGEQDYEAVDRQLKIFANDLRNGKRTFSPLAQAMARFRQIRLAEFKVVASKRLATNGQQAGLRLRVELGGIAEDGRLLSLLGHMDTVWSLDGAGWNLASARLEGFRENRASGRFFTEITEQALGHERSFRLQLAKSVDHWRSVLDEATGIDVYGHNGIAIGDYDGDGLEDIYVSQPSGLPNRLYRNNGDGTFTDQTTEAGLDILDNTAMALFADVDNDGDRDLIAITSTQPLLFRNHGKGRYRLDEKSGFDAVAGRTGSLTGAAVADYDNDGYLDVYVCSYHFWSPGAAYDVPAPYYDATNGPPNFLFRNRGDGTFEDVTDRSGLTQNNDRFSFAAAWGDYDNDGDQDLYVANDFGRNNLYRNNGDGTFRDVAAEAGVEDIGAGMSAAWADYDGDGLLDLYVGNMWSSAGLRLTHKREFARVTGDSEARRFFQRHARGNSLFRNNGDGTFTDVTLDAGVEMGRWAWASDFIDIDNDGREDLFIQNGYITGPDTHDL